MTPAAVDSAGGTSSILRKNIAALGTLQAVNCVVPLITVPYLVRMLGPANFGLLSFAQAVAGYFDLVTNYGFGLSATRAVARLKGEPAALAHTFWTTMYAKAALMLASAATLALIGSASPALRGNAALYLGSFLTVVGSVTLPVFFYQGTEQMVRLTIAQGSVRLLSAPALFLFVRHADDYSRAAAIQGAVPVLASLLLAPSLWKQLACGPHRPAIQELRRSLQGGWRMFVADAGIALNFTTTPIVLGLAAGNTEVGFYSAADKLIRAACAALGPVSQALYPRLNRLRTRSASETVLLLRKSRLWFGGFAAVASVCIFVLARPAGLLIWGGSFDRSITVLRMLAPLPVVLAMVHILGIQTMLVFDMDAQLSRIVLLGAFLSPCLAALLSLEFGAAGAAAAMVAAGSVVVVSLARSVRRLPLA
jgi:polysaccharide transporter, PST family